MDTIEYLPNGSMVVHAGSMEVVVPPHFVREPSRDGFIHICAVSITAGKYEPVCLFMPGTM